MALTLDRFESYYQLNVLLVVDNPDAKVRSDRVPFSLFGGWCVFSAGLFVSSYVQSSMNCTV